MNCRNCHTGLMASDTRCPVCGMATPLGRAAATSLEARAAVNPVSRRQFIVKKWVQCVFASLLGVLLLGGGALVYLDTRSSHPVARNVTAAELARLDKPEELPDWVTFVPSRTIDTGVKYVKVQSRQEMSKFLLLQVENHWLFTKVDARFNGTRFEGRLCPLDRVALAKALAADHDKAKGVLPFMLDAEYDIAGTRRRSFFYAGALAAFGVLAFCTGVRRGFTKPPPFLGAAPQGPVADVPPQRETSFSPAKVGLATEGLVGPSRPRPAPFDSPPEQPPRGRRWFVRTFFGMVWAVVFFIGGVVVASLWATAGAGDDPELRKQLAEEAGRQQGPLLLLGSLVLATVLGVLGWLPGTRRRKRLSTSGESAAHGVNLGGLADSRRP